MLTSSQLWLLRSIVVIGLTFSLAVGSNTSVFAEESDQPAAEEEAVVSPPPYSGGKTSTKPTDAETWAVIDPNTGDVLNITVCTPSVCGPGGSFGGKLRDAETGIVGDLVRQGSSSQGGWRSGGDTSVTHDRDTGSFVVKHRSGADSLTSSADSSTSFRITPQQGQDSKVSDIESTTTKRSGETSGTLRTYRSDHQDNTVDATIELPDLGERGSLLTYEVEARTSESNELPAALNQISFDVDALLMENGYVSSETTVDEGTGEETNAEVVDSSNDFVAAIREVVGGLVDWLSSLVGFGRD